MTKCIITGKTYPDHKPQQHRSVNAARKNMEYGLGQLDWLNAEHLGVARKLYECIQHLHQNRSEEFSHTLMEVAGLSDHFICHRNSLAYDRIRDALAVQNGREAELVPINTVRAPVFKQAVAEIAEYILEDTYQDAILVTDDNGDERYTDEAQERFNEHHDAVEGILSEYFEPDDVCRNGKPIADCQCC